MVSLTLWPLAPWQAAHTVAALALPASISAACANGAKARTTDNPSSFSMVFSLRGNPPHSITRRPSRRPVASCHILCAPPYGARPDSGRRRPAAIVGEDHEDQDRHRSRRRFAALGHG